MELKKFVVVLFSIVAIVHGSIIVNSKFIGSITQKDGFIPTPAQCPNRL